MTSKLTRERIEQYANDPRMCNINDEISELARMALAAMDSEPVAVPDHLTYIREPTLENILSDTEENSPMSHAARILAREVKFWRSTPLYRHAQPAPDRKHVRREHAEWSQSTFGNVGPVGPLKHLRREVLEAIAKPHDLIEWADMQFLLWDAQRRAGITDEQITQSMIEKLAVNKQREWPEPKDGEPRLHIKEQAAAPDKKLTDDVLDEIIVGAKTSMEQYLALSLKAERKVWRQEGPTDDERIMAIEGMIKCLRCGDNGWVVGEMGITRCACGQAGNSPVIPDTWIPVCERMPEPNKFVLVSNGVWVGQGTYNESEHFEDDERWQDEHGEFINLLHHPVTHWQPLPPAPKQENI